MSIQLYLKIKNVLALYVLSPSHHSYICSNIPTSSEIFFLRHHWSCTYQFRLSFVKLFQKHSLTFTWHFLSFIYPFDTLFFSLSLLSETQQILTSVLFYSVIIVLTNYTNISTDQLKRNSTNIVTKHLFFLFCISFQW